MHREHFQAMLHTREHFLSLIRGIKHLQALDSEMGLMRKGVTNKASLCSFWGLR